jgi:hypothetical protein
MNLETLLKQRDMQIAVREQAKRGEASLAVALKAYAVANAIYKTGPARLADSGESVVIKDVRNAFFDYYGNPTIIYMVHIPSISDEIIRLESELKPA